MLLFQQRHDSLFSSSDPDADCCRTFPASVSQEAVLKLHLRALLGKPTAGTGAELSAGEGH